MSDGTWHRKCRSAARNSLTRAGEIVSWDISGCGSRREEKSQVARLRLAASRWDIRGWTFRRLIRSVAGSIRETKRGSRTCSKAGPVVKECARDGFPKQLDRITGAWRDLPGVGSFVGASGFALSGGAAESPGEGAGTRRLSRRWRECLAVPRARGREEVSARATGGVEMRPRVVGGAEQRLLRGRRGSVGAWKGGCSGWGDVYS